MRIVEIQPGLWLGDEKSANNLNFMTVNDIKHSINCNKYLNYSSHKYNSPVKDKLEKNEINHTIKSTSSRIRIFTVICSIKSPFWGNI